LGEQIGARASARNAAYRSKLFGGPRPAASSGLPFGFDPKTSIEKSNIDNGLPYLIANPPPK
jgi:hypothetical protein